MKISNIKHIEFWAREQQMPLFWFTDPEHKMFRNNVLIFYKKPQFHTYYLNNLKQKRVNFGHEYFKNSAGFAKYFKLAENEIKKINNFVTKTQTIEFNKISDNQLKKIFFDLRKILNDYSDVYTKSEASSFEKFEDRKDKQIKKLLNQVGKVRFKLRKKGESAFFLLLDKVFKEIAKRYNLKIKAELYFYTFKELKNLFNKGKKVPANEIAKRRKGFALWKMNHTYEVLTGKKYLELFSWVNQKFIPKKISQLKGHVVCPGKIKAKVRVIIYTKRNIVKKMAQFRKGEVLVTDMTKPDMVSICKEASAIITDEGGIISHAAVVSREFKKPCIVGTKIATQVLQDGDEVEVDADAEKGLVTINKKAQ